jgi:hypothetical protein
MFREYLDFEIRIGTLASEGYPISVRGPGGDARGTLALPTQLPAYQRAVGQLAALDTHEVDLIQLGRLLFDALFTTRIKEVYTRSQGKLRDDQGLRLVFEIDTAEAAVAAMPWEFLADPDQGPLAMLDAPMVRYIPLQTSIPTLAVPLPLKVLLTGAELSSPGQVAQELHEVQQALDALGEQVSITVESHLTRTILQRRLREGYHVWHFVGHGALGLDEQTGFLQFEDAAGVAEPVSALELSILLKRCGVRLVVLNICQSATLQLDPLHSIAPALVRADVPAVVALQLSLSDAGARAFAGEFYRTLAEGYPIDACVTEGRKSVMSKLGLGRPDWGIPVVYTRAADGRLFAPPAPTATVPSGERRPIGDGLLALRTLMETPAVYGAVASGRDQFQDVLRQIAMLGRYKGLHDRLQQLEDCARIVDGDRRRLPQDPHTWSDLARSEEDLHGKIDAVLECAGNAPADAHWTGKLKRGQQEARTGVEQGDLNLLARALNRVDDVLGSVPWSINKGLIQIAEGLPLHALAQKLASVATRLSTLDLDEWTARQYDVFVQGVAALERLDVRLAQLVLRHNLFQNLDNELRRVEIGLNMAGNALALVWPDLLPLHAQVCDDQAAVWATRLVAIATELERSLAAPGDQRTTMIFWRYRGQVSQSFNHVDTDLLRLCEELQGIGKSLDFVLRTVP